MVHEIGPLTVKGIRRRGEPSPVRRARAAVMPEASRRQAARADRPYQCRMPAEYARVQAGSRDRSIVHRLRVIETSRTRVPIFIGDRSTVWDMTQVMAMHKHRITLTTCRRFIDHLPGVSCKWVDRLITSLTAPKPGRCRPISPSSGDGTE